jgi:hypothetical protein
MVKGGNNPVIEGYLRTAIFPSLNPAIKYFPEALNLVIVYWHNFVVKHVFKLMSKFSHFATCWYLSVLWLTTAVDSDSQSRDDAIAYFSEWSTYLHQAQKLHLPWPSQIKYLAVLTRARWNRNA